MNGGDVDRRIAQAIRRYFDLRSEAAHLRKRLEEARGAAGEDIAAFYDPGRNAAHAAEILSLHHVRREMAKLMEAAEMLAAEEGRGHDAASPRAETSPGSIVPEDGAELT